MNQRDGLANDNRRAFWQQAVALLRVLMGASKPVTLSGKELAQYAGFFHVYEGVQQNGQSTQHGERTGDSGIAWAGPVRATSVGRGLAFVAVALADALEKWKERMCGKRSWARMPGVAAATPEREFGESRE